MDYYRILLLDQPKTSWVLHDIEKLLPKSKPGESSSAFYKFFAPPDAEVRMKAKYQRLCCKRCGRYETDEIFRAGFEEPVAIRFKQDMGYTDDRIFVVNDKCLSVLKKNRVEGFETKAIGRSGWHALTATLRIETAKGLLKPLKPNCAECGRASGATAIIFNLNQISAPNQPNLIFSTRIGSPSLGFMDRDLFLTGDVVKSLKASGIKGSPCERLWTNQEVERYEQEEKKGNRWSPPGLLVQLRGK